MTEPTIPGMIARTLAEAIAEPIPEPLIEITIEEEEEEDYYDDDTELLAMVQAEVLAKLPGIIAPAHTPFTRVPIGTIGMATDAAELKYACSTDAKTGAIIIRSEASGKWFVVSLLDLIAIAQLKGIDVRESLLHTQPTEGLILPPS